MMEFPIVLTGNCSKELVEWIITEITATSHDIHIFKVDEELKFQALTIPLSFYNQPQKYTQAETLLFSWTLGCFELYNSLNTRLFSFYSSWCFLCD